MDKAIKESKAEEPSTGLFIDIDHIIKSKNPRLYRFLPGFIIRYLKRIVHQDFVNEFIRINGNNFGLDFVETIVKEFIRETRIIGLENIPQEGRYLIASNHPLGGLDGVALMNQAGKRRTDIVFPVNDLLMNLKNLEVLFIPINKHGTNAENIRIIDSTFASEKMILYFPAGLVSRKQKGIIRDLEWKKTFLSKARKFGRDIIPAYVDGRNSNFFYNLSNFRKLLGVKQNIEMLYLVNEMMKQKSKTLTMTFGKPIPIGVFDKRFNDYQWAAYIKEHVYSLCKDPDITFPY